MNRQFRSAAAPAPGVEARRPRDDRDNAPVEDGLQELRVVGSEGNRSRSIRIAIVTVVCFLVSAAAAVFFFIVPSSVPSYVVNRGPAVVELTGPGILDATNKVTITSRIPGFLHSIGVDRNAAVAAGQLLAELDVRDVESQLDGARADVEAARSAVAEASGNRAKAKAQLDKAQSDVSRRRSLSSGIVSVVEIEALEIAVRQAQAEYERSMAVEHGASARVAVAAAQVGVLQHKRNEAQIRSPLDGVVVSRDRSVGDLLTAGVQLFQIVDPKTIVIATRLDESIMSLIEPGQAAKVRFTSDAVQTVNASVMRVSRAVDPETREFIVELTPERLPRNWALGQRAHVAIEVSLPAGVAVVPLAFIARHDGRPGVWRLVSGRARWEPIEPGNVSGSYIQVLQGVVPGDVILEPRGRYRLEAITTKGSSE